MANQSIINNSKLDAIVAAIVAKGGGTAPMTADQMAAAIAAIPAGVDHVNELVGGTLTSFTADNALGQVVTHAFCGCTLLTSVDLSGARGIGGTLSVGEYAFQTCGSLVNLVLPQTIYVEFGSYVFTGCRAFAQAIAGKISRVGPYCFANSKIPSFANSYPQGNSKKIWYMESCFQACSMLTRVDLACAPIFNKNVFKNCSALEAIVIRDTETVGELQTNAFAGCTPITNGTAFIYVPDALVDTYKAATNWTAYSTLIKPLSEYVEPAA